MSTREKPGLLVEQPDTDALIDFLHEGVLVRLTVKDGKLRVHAAMSHGPQASTWDDHEVEWPLPEKETTR